MPDLIQFKNGNQIINKYDASGWKLSTRYFTLATEVVVPMGQTRKWVYDLDIINETGTFYVDNFEYKFNGCDPGVYMLDKVYNSEGYADRLATMNGPYYNYYRCDHLGNNREVWCSNTNTTIQSTQYYPSGLPWAEGTGQDIQNRKYNGKEFVEMHGWDEYDSQARTFYPAIVRTPTLDPLCEKYYDISPYAWCGNNPVNVVDPNGEEIYILGDSKNNLEFWEGVGTLLKTEDGKKLWNEYASSVKEDLYIGVNSFKSDKEAAGAALKNIGESGGIKDNKIDISKFGDNKEVFSNFQGHDVSKSKGRSVSLISLDAGELKKNSKKSDSYQNAEIIYHEMKAHIKDGGSNDHERYGNYSTGLKLYYSPVYGNDLGLVPYVKYPAWKVKTGTPYERIRHQLLILKDHNSKSKK